MLHDSPGNRIRLFHADDGHELWKNDVIANAMSLGYHAHHCDIRLVHIFGPIKNITAQIHRVAATGESDLREYRYESKILTGKSSLTATGAFYNITSAHSKDLNVVNRIYMTAKAKHTVFVPRFQQAAWFVFESAEDPDYEPYVYTNNDKYSDEGLYVQGDSLMAADILQICVNKHE